jgi:hypothetical protein
VLHALVREHLSDFLRESRERSDRGLPRYVERELRGYLRCNLLKYGPSGRRVARGSPGRSAGRFFCLLKSIGKLYWHE